MLYGANISKYKETQGRECRRRYLLKARLTKSARLFRGQFFRLMGTSKNLRLARLW